MAENFCFDGSRQADSIDTDKYIADVSAILMKNLPWWAQLRRGPRFSVAVMDEWEKKLSRIAEIIAYQNIVSISGVPSWNDIGQKNIRDYRDKTCEKFGLI